MPISRDHKPGLAGSGFYPALSEGAFTGTGLDFMMSYPSPLPLGDVLVIRPRWVPRSVLGDVMNGLGVCGGCPDPIKKGKESFTQTSQNGGS